MAWHGMACVCSCSSPMDGSPSVHVDVRTTTTDFVRPWQQRRRRWRWWWLERTWSVSELQYPAYRTVPYDDFKVRFTQVQCMYIHAPKAPSGSRYVAACAVLAVLYVVAGRKKETQWPMLFLAGRPTRTSKASQCIRPYPPHPTSGTRRAVQPIADHAHWTTHPLCGIAPPMEPLEVLCTVQFAKPLFYTFCFVSFRFNFFHLASHNLFISALSLSLFVSSVNPRLGFFVPCLARWIPCK